MKIQDSSGQTWRVTRRWVPWRRRLKGVLSSFGVPGGVEDPFSLIILLVLGIPTLILITIAGLELLVLLLIFPFALLGRVIFGRHWTIEARIGFKIWHQEDAGDWQASGLAIHAMADAIRHGDLHPPPQTVDVAPETKPGPHAE